MRENSKYKESKTEITIFTPAYNREGTLYRLYNSLCKQSDKNFKWVIVDDGSTDNTEVLVKEWIEKNVIPIAYIKKENGGLGSAYNAALQFIDTPLNVCIDSDDFMPEDAIETILKVWHKNNDYALAGIIGLDFDAKTKEPLGGYFNESNCKFHVLEIESKLHHYGDFKMVVRTDLLKPLLPMPSFPGEKNFNPMYLYLLIDPSKKYFVINENLCFVDYQPDGMRAGIYKQFKNSPRSFGEIRKAKLNHPLVSFKRKVIDAAHLISSTLIARDITVLKGKYNKLFLFPALPLGFAFYFFINYKARK